MKITTFDPVIDTAKPDDLIGLFEELGFTTTHTPLKDGVIRLNRMKHADGFHVEVAADPSLQQDKTCIRINVDDLEEAAAILTAQGFQPKIIHGDNPTSKGMHMLSPTGLMFILIQHIKNQ